MKGYSLHKKHNAEDARLKARPLGRSPKTRLSVIAFHHAMSMLSKQCLDSGFWAAPEIMTINQSCPKLIHRICMDLSCLTRIQHIRLSAPRTVRNNGCPSI
jgi:hypothetical protein